MKRTTFLILLICWLGVSVGQRRPNWQPSTVGLCAVQIPRPTGDVCITYGEVHQAFTQAFASSELSKIPPGSPVGPDALGPVVLETSRLLVRKFRLMLHEIPFLTEIETRRTAINNYCPPLINGQQCEASRYRSITGMCNNLRNAHWGAAQAPFRRLLPAVYADGLSSPRISVTGQPLPTARRVSLMIHQSFGRHEKSVTAFLPAFGQLIGHDMDNHARTKLPLMGPRRREPPCCSLPVEQRHSSCMSIELAADDPFYSQFGHRCNGFARLATGLRQHCRLGNRPTFNAATSFIDASFVYGSDEVKARSLRSFRNGLMRTSPNRRGGNLKDLLPPNVEDPDNLCRRDNDQTINCYFTGDHRPNQTPMLIVGHTIFMREHNRIATELGRINPRWNDERLYQEARRVVAAFVQHITFNEFLPVVLGPTTMRRYQLTLQSNGMGNFYSADRDATLPVAFNAAAYRFGHSLVPPALERWSVSHRFVASHPLSELFSKPFNDDGGMLDQYTTGFMNQVAQAVDESVSDQLTNHLFQPTQSQFGQDLAARNIQRNRDQGMPGYTAFREWCGLGTAREWNDLVGTINNVTLQKFRQTYASVHDIDLWSAGVSESHMPNALVGPVFGCIMGETFRNLRLGDRFWYENGGLSHSFSQDQLNEIRKIRLARIICDNSDGIKTVQSSVMLLPSPNGNPRVSCQNSILPRVNLNLWRE